MGVGIDRSLCLRLTSSGEERGLTADKARCPVVQPQFYWPVSLLNQADEAAGRQLAGNQQPGSGYSVRPRKTQKE